VIGHEFAGEIVAVGKAVKRHQVGDYVSGEGHLFCGVCQMCRTGQAHICEDWVGLGYDVDGAFAEYLTLPEVNLWKNDPAVPAELAAIQDPLGNAVHAVFAADCVTKKVVVFGCGPGGLLAVAVLHIEIAGTQAAVRSAVQSVHPGGDLVLLGLPSQPVTFDVSEEIVFKAIHIHGITGRRIYDTWYRMKGLLRNPNIKLNEIITHSFPFADYEKGFQLMRQGNCGKVILEL